MGFCSFEDDPSPNVHDHEFGEFVDLSVNWTGNGLLPSLVDAEKSAFGGIVGITAVGTVVGWVVGVVVTIVVGREVGGSVGVMVGVTLELEIAMKLEREKPFDPDGFDTFNLTEYIPAFKYVWDGFCTLEVDPSPNVHDQLVGEPVEMSLKDTTRGIAPVIGLAVKPAFRIPVSGGGVSVGDGDGVCVGVVVGIAVGVDVGVGVGVSVGDGVGGGVTPMERSIRVAAPSTKTPV